MNTKGIGLGLAIAEQIIDKFDGKITFKSVYGEGSTFRFTMRLFADSEMAIINNAQCEVTSSNQEVKYKVNSKELVFKWNPKIHKQIKEYIPSNIQKSKLKNERTVTQHLASTIQYINEQQGKDDEKVIRY